MMTSHANQELAREIQLTDWSTVGNLSNRSSGVQIPRDICTRFGRYLYSTRCSWIIISNIAGVQIQCQHSGFDTTVNNNFQFDRAVRPTKLTSPEKDFEKDFTPNGFQLNGFHLYILNEH